MKIGDRVRVVKTGQGNFQDHGKIVAMTMSEVYVVFSGMERNRYFPHYLKVLER